MDSARYSIRSEPLGMDQYFRRFYYRPDNGARIMIQTPILDECDIDSTSDSKSDGDVVMKTDDVVESPSSSKRRKLNGSNSPNGSLLNGRLSNDVSKLVDHKMNSVVSNPHAKSNGVVSESEEKSSDASSPVRTTSVNSEASKWRRSNRLSQKRSRDESFTNGDGDESATRNSDEASGDDGDDSEYDEGNGESDDEKSNSEDERVVRTVQRPRLGFNPLDDPTVSFWWSYVDSVDEVRLTTRFDWFFTG